MDTHMKTLVVGELEKGIELATILQTLIRQPSANHGSISAQQLAQKILSTFDQALSHLNSRRILAGDRINSPCSGGRRSKGHGEVSRPKHRRGAYKKRRVVHDSWVTVSPKLEDGFAWRKYGQKGILNSIYPRCYFRCSHKLDQCCGATKHVQKISEDPFTYRTTYFGHHTCIYAGRACTIMSSNSLPSESNLFVNFEAENPMKQDDAQSIDVTAVPEELKEESQSNLSDDQKPSQYSMTSRQVLSRQGSTLPVETESRCDEVVSSGSTRFDGAGFTSFNTFNDLDDDLYFDEVKYLCGPHAYAYEDSVYEF